MWRRAAAAPGRRHGRVSGSGKSTLARDVLLANVQPPGVGQRATKAGRDAMDAGKFAAADWLHRSARVSRSVDRVLEVDQTPIGKTPRSCPATLHRLLGHRAQALCRHAGSQGARLWARAFQLQHRRRPLPRRAKARACAPSRMSFLPDVKVLVRGLPRRALQPRDAGRDMARQKHWRCAADGSRSRRWISLRRCPNISAPTATPEGRRFGLPHARPAVSPTLSRW
jgi:hypothetical protein